MKSQRIRVLTSLSWLLLDIVLIAIAFILAFQLRQLIDWPQPLANYLPLSRYLPLMGLHIANVVIVLFFLRQYVVRRTISRIDQFYAVFLSATLGTMLALGTSLFLLRNSRYEIEYSRGMIIYSWGLTVMLVIFGRILHQIVMDTLQQRGWGRDRLLIVGTGDVAQIILQRILWSPQLGYELVGLVNGEPLRRRILGVPVLGKPEDLPSLIERFAIDEVIIAIPEEGHREVIKVISYCQRGQVSIKIFPDIFQFVTSQANIDDLGGLPLLSVRDYAMRGYLLVMKRIMDVAGASLGLIVFSPVLLLIAIAIKLESPGPAFFVQQRMGLDGKPFRMLKFRSMRKDAEKDGPGWTVQNDPRQTRLGTFLRLLEFDEFPQIINVLLGEMSLVGPRPEQPYYVDQFRRSVPDYMERHREKAGMTGWAQINGMRGDTSITERTKYDLWYTENWSIMLDVKILLRTLWHVVRSVFVLLGITLFGDDGRISDG